MTNAKEVVRNEAADDVPSIVLSSVTSISLRLVGCKFRLQRRPRLVYSDRLRATGDGPDTLCCRFLVGDLTDFVERRSEVDAIVAACTRYGPLRGSVVLEQAGVTQLREHDEVKRAEGRQLVLIASGIPLEPFERLATELLHHFARTWPQAACQLQRNGMFVAFIGVDE